MSYTQNIFKSLMQNDGMVKRFQDRYTADDLQRMYGLTSDEAGELHGFVNHTEPGQDGFR